MQSAPPTKAQPPATNWPRSLAVGSLVANLVALLILPTFALPAGWPAPRSRPDLLLATLGLDFILTASFFASARSTDNKTRRLAGCSIILALVQQLFPLFGYYMNFWEVPWFWVFVTLVPFAVCCILFRRFFILGLVVLASAALFLPFMIPPIGGQRSQTLDGLTLTVTSSSPDGDGQRIPDWIPWQAIGLKFRTTDGSDPLQRVYFHGINMEGSVSPFFHLRSPSWVRGLRMEDGSAGAGKIIETPASAKSFNLEINVPLYPDKPDCSFKVPVPVRFQVSSQRVSLGSGSILATMRWDDDSDKANDLLVLSLSNPVPPDAATSLVFNYGNSLESPFDHPGRNGEILEEPIQMLDSKAKYIVVNSYKRSSMQSHVLHFKFSRLANVAGY